MPSLIIMSYFLTTKKVKAVVVNNFEYGFLDKRLLIFFKSRLVQNCIALALCHPDEVVDIFVSHVIEKSVTLQRKYPRFNEFISYMLGTWIEGEGDNGSLFKI